MSTEETAYVELAPHDLVVKKKKPTNSDNLATAATDMVEVAKQLCNTVEKMQETAKGVGKLEDDFKYQYDYNRQLIESLTTQKQTYEGKLDALKDQTGLEMLNYIQRTNHAEEGHYFWKRAAVMTWVFIVSFLVSIAASRHYEIPKKVLDILGRHANMKQSSVK